METEIQIEQNIEMPTGAVWQAVINKDVAALLDAIKNGELLNERHGVDLWTPLMYVCAYGDKKIARVLLSKKALINAQTRLGHTVLMLMVAKGDISMAEMLIKARAGINKKTDKSITALMIAACKNDMKMVNLLLKNNANPCLKNNFEQNAADMARMHGHYKVAAVIEQAISKR